MGEVVVATVAGRGLRRLERVGHRHRECTPGMMSELTPIGIEASECVARHDERVDANRHRSKRGRVSLS